MKKNAQGEWVMQPGDVVKFELAPFNNHTKKTKGKLSLTHGRQIEMSVAGYGDFHSENGHGTPILIEMNSNNVLSVCLWDNINAQDPKVHGMAYAKEEKREAESVLSDMTNYVIYHYFTDGKRSYINEK